MSETLGSASIPANSAMLLLICARSFWAIDKHVSNTLWGCRAASAAWLGSGEIARNAVR